ncbi:Ycf66 family protein [Nostoc sp. 106C]|uniref:protein kinase domain-containing protein n=1 Tax=Nostoc sp. 106C TaxID=1932667 RepID=UPI000A3B1C75|nr:Ycf66 family protein [Nostoc sp. 106C]OUL19315.1 serine/threonine protein kinase [Nostoc sp. 106C]OUL27105.1 serine/threonine protein kinase [Nostoc sp. RF31YmG]
MLGKLLDGRYKVIQVLSAGGFGETYIVEDTRRPGNPKCVLKLLKPATSDPNYLQIARRLFNSEAEILEQLGNHDQIPRLLAYFEENEEFCLVQELIVGHPLSAEMQLGKCWHESQVIQMLQDVLGILEFVHSYGVIHRDLKPDNLIRRDSDGKLVLIDFGAVKQMQTQIAASPSQTAATVAIGTPGYMPAEQAQGKPRHNSDIYAVGMVAIQALTGMSPRQLPENPETGEIVWQNYTQVSLRLADFVQKMVRYHYRDRYQSATEVLQDLRELVNFSAPTQPLISPPVSASAPTQPVNSPPVSNSPTQPPTTAIPVGDRGDAFQPASQVTAVSSLNQALSVIRFIPFVGAAGLFFFKSTTWIVLLGVGLAAFGAGLFFLRSWYSKVARDYDAVFAVIFCICGILLLFQNQYVKPEIQMSQFLLAGIGIFSLAECIRLRGLR